MHTYVQSTGDIVLHTGVWLSGGYSGHGEGVNNPDDQYMPNIGPIPVGTYTMGEPFTHPTAGPFVMRLTPLPGTNTHGRDGFLMHGDTVSMDHTASHGCIVASRGHRSMVDETSVDRLLRVVSTPDEA